MAKQNRIATVSVNDGKIVWAFQDDGPDVTLDPTKLSDDVKDHALLHGLVQRGRDSYAGADNTADAREKLGAVLETLASGEWSRRGEGGGAQTTQLMQAVANVTGKDIDTVRERFKTLTEAQKKALRKDARIALALEKIKAAAARERMKALAESAKAETGDLL